MLALNTCSDQNQRMHSDQCMRAIVRYQRPIHAVNASSRAIDRRSARSARVDLATACAYATPTKERRAYPLTTRVKRIPGGSRTGFTVRNPPLRDWHDRQKRLTREAHPRRLSSAIPCLSARGFRPWAKRSQHSRRHASDHRHDPGRIEGRWVSAWFAGLSEIG